MPRPILKEPEALELKAGNYFTSEKENLEFIHTGSTMLDRARLKYLMTYDPITGLFTWNVSRHKFKRGDVAGWITEKGHRRIEIEGKAYRAARLAWFYMTGEWPSAQIDHKNPDEPGNDSWSNLRLATNGQNKANQRLAKNNKTGFKGVSFDKKTGKYRAILARQTLGYFTYPEEAYEEYRRASIEKYGEYHRDA